MVNGKAPGKISTIVVVTRILVSCERDAYYFTTCFALVSPTHYLNEVCPKLLRRWQPLSECITLLW